MSFFLQTEIGQDAADAAGADDQTGLADLLGDEVQGGVRGKEGVANDLMGEVDGAAGRALRAGFATEQGQATALCEGGEELVIALLGVAVLDGGGGGTEPFAFPFDEHGQFAENLVVAFRQNKLAGAAGYRMGGGGEPHGTSTSGENRW